MVQSFYRRQLQNTTNNVTGAQEDHDRSRYAAYSVNVYLLIILEFGSAQRHILLCEYADITKNIVIISTGPL